MSRPAIDVLYEDNHLIVVNKPPLIPTMGVAAGTPSMVTLVKDYLRDQYRKPGNVYLGVVSRLDAFSCGVLCFARTSKAAARLSRQFQLGQVAKTYWAIVEETPDCPGGTMVDWVIKDDSRRRMVTTDESKPGSRRAELRWKLLGADRQQCLVEVELMTGRKHQIRLQFADRGWPVLGDRKYGGKQAFRGIGLLSKSVSLLHPVRKDHLTIEIEPPPEWKIVRFLNI